ncbi:MAG TPA: gliding motility-associated C-terminal domain-containing protein [Phnomibacter sp.]|nr:gliding motility-associated C-terminal domain-containing protein [Phnomibacter sp.]
MERTHTAYTVVFLLILLTCRLYGQTVCNTPGQNPNTAFPVCGTSVFNQTSVNLCGGRQIPHPTCSPGYDDRNPYYYKFTCFQSGTLGFTITPNNASSDYDWQIFDITGRNPNEIFTNVNLTICSNWSGNPGTTGTNGTAANLHACGGNTPNFSRWPSIIQGREYLLMISHFTNTQAGYKLEFGGGTAVITDPNMPLMQALEVSCGGTEFYLKLNKPVKCSSIAADGSDWEFFNGNVPIASARGAGCNNGFDTDSIIITTVNAVPAGSFALRSKTGTDGNTLLDICDNQLAAGQTLVVNRLPVQPSVIDSIRPVQCRPTEVQLVMSSDMLCNSIAADGSDFQITGPAPVVISGAVQNSCSNGRTNVIRVQFQRPITVGGTYTLSVKQGTDGNTLLNNCAEPTIAGTSATFLAYDSVSGRIDISVQSSCTADTITFSSPSANGINSWKWTETGRGVVGSAAVYQKINTDTGEVRMTLEVSNGVCSGIGVAVVSLSNLRVKAAFDHPGFACPGDTVLFTDRSTGPVSSWYWDLGNGSFSTQPNPPYQFYSSAAPLSQIPVKLVVADDNGCSDTLVQQLQVPNNCYIDVPNAFTPNGDGLNDFLYPLNAWKATDLLFRVYDRYGQLVWETRDWTQKWDGRRKGQPMPSGTLVWTLEYTDSVTGRRFSQKGTTTLIR